MRFLILDNKQLSAEDLQEKLLIIDPKAEILAVCHSCREATDFLSKGQINPDIIFSDIWLADERCFDALKKAPQETGIVFTTSYREADEEAFSFYNVSFLPKPVSLDELKKVIEKYKITRFGIKEHIALPLLDRKEIVRTIMVP